MKKMFTLLALMFLIPLSVNAEVKEIDEKVYVINEQDVANYCEQLKNVESISFEYYDDSYVFVDNVNTKRYLYNINNKTCKEIEYEEYNKLQSKKSYYSNRYVIIEGTIYEISYTEEGIVEKFIPAMSHGALTGKEDFYILKDGKYEITEENDVNNLDLYYVKTKFGKAKMLYRDWKTYYTVKDDNSFVAVDTPNEEDFKKGLYYEKKKMNEVYKNIKKISTAKFLLKKEISGLTADKEFNINDYDEFTYIYKIKDKFYFAFDSDSSKGYGNFVFDEDGNIVKIEDNYLFHELDAFSKVSENGLFSTFVKNNEEKNIFYILDENFNIINKKEVKGSFIAYFPKYLNSYEHTDYFNLANSYVNSIDYGFNEVSSYYLINGDKKYNNKDMNYTLSANLKELKSVFIKDKEISKDNFTTKDNVLTLKNKYLSTLEKGNYKLKVLYNDGGYVNAEFTIDVIANPQTGDNIIKTIIIGSVSLLGLIITILYIKRKKQFN